MSALAAIFHFDGRPVVPTAIEDMLERMASRAPDGASSWVEGNVGLGHGLLINTPEARHERQPFAAFDGRWHMVWDGRLDNRDEIRHELHLQGVTPRDDTDPELVLQLFLLHGEATPERLLGDFAFVVHDRSEQTLFCARDHVGARPLHYVLTEHFIAIASTDDALIPLLPNGARPNVDRLIYAALPLLDDFDWSDGWIDGIKTLLPGSFMQLGIGRRLRRRQYWAFTAQPEDRALAAARPDDAVAAFAAVLERATRDRLRAPGAPAMLLSGGIDSACVAASIHRQQGPVSTLACSVVSDPEIDCIESAAIHSMLVTLRWPACQIQVPSFAGAMSEAEVAALAWQRPHPVDNSILLVHALASLAARAGQRVVLNGVSGDLAFYAPDDYYLHVARHTGWRAAFTEMRLMRERHVYQLGRSVASLLARALWTHAVPLPVKQLRPVRWRSARALAAESGLDPKVLRDRHIVERIRRAWAEADRFARLTLAEQHAAVLRPPGIVRGFEGYDRVGGRVGVEMRDPLADVRVLQWLQRAPLALRSAEGRTKWVGREYVRRVFGDAVAWRSDKSHLGWQLVVAAPHHNDESIKHDNGIGTTERGYAHRSVLRWHHGLPP
ncbi:MAG: hypothetical protein LC098_07970 [Burkholderiales bacterium]|nr:hypothetical protein [Burkholderiales bacterium]